MRIWGTRPYQHMWRSDGQLQCLAWFYNNPEMQHKRWRRYAAKQYPASPDPASPATAAAAPRAAAGPAPASPRSPVGPGTAASSPRTGPATAASDPVDASPEVVTGGWDYLTSVPGAEDDTPAPPQVRPPPPHAPPIRAHGTSTHHFVDPCLCPFLAPSPRPLLLVSTVPALPQ